MEKLSNWLALLCGLVLGLSIGGLIVYAILLSKDKTMLKTFTYDDTGRLIQVMKQEGV